MKISAIGPHTYFNGSEQNYKDTIKEKSNTTIKLAIGTAIAGAGLLAAYYITKKPPKINQKNTTSKTLQETTNNIKESAQNLQEKADDIKESTQTILKENGQKIIKKYFYDGATEKIEKSFYDKHGKKIKKQQVITELIYTSKIPTGYKKTITNFKDNKQTTQRVTYLSLDEKPQKTISNNKTVDYFYDLDEPNKIIGHAFSTGDKKLILQLEKDKNFKKEFSNLENIHKWINTNYENL